MSPEPDDTGRMQKRAARVGSEASFTGVSTTPLALTLAPLIVVGEVRALLDARAEVEAAPGVGVVPRSREAQKHRAPGLSERPRLSAKRRGGPANSPPRRG